MDFKLISTKGKPKYTAYENHYVNVNMFSIILFLQKRELLNLYDVNLCVVFTTNVGQKLQSKAESESNKTKQTSAKPQFDGYL